MMDRDQELRRLKKMRTSLWIVLLLNVSAMVADHPYTLYALALDALIFISMKSALARDIASLGIKLPED